MRRLVALLIFFVLWVPGAYAWTWPVTGPVLQSFSFDPAHPYASGQHRGIDIAASATGIPVLAPASGVVSYAGTVPTSGKSVTIETAEGLSVTLTHLGSYAVKKNTTVAEGDTVGTVGPSGTPDFDQPYLHLGIRTTAETQGYLDPLGFLPSLAPPPAPPEPAPAPAPAPAVEAPPVVVEQPPVPAPAPAPAPVEQAPPPVVEAPVAIPEPVPVVLSVEDPGPDLVLAPRPLSMPPAAAPVAVAPPPPKTTAATRSPAATWSPTLLHTSIHVPALSRPGRRELPAAHATRSVRPHPHPHVPVLWLGLFAAAALLVAARMIVRWFEGARSDEVAAEDPRRGRVAVRERPETSGPRRRPGRAVRHLRPLPPLERQRRPDGERDGRARDAGDGLRRPGRRVAA